MGPKRGANKGFAFVLADETGKSRSEDRKMIRSHVMRGKNTRKAEPSPAVASAGEGSSSRQAPSQAQALVPMRPKAVAQIGDDSNEAASERNGDASVTKVLSAPHDIHMFKFADEVDDMGRSMIYDFYAVIKESMYPVEWCLQFDMSKSPWFHWLVSDAAYLHLALATSSMIHESVRGLPSSKRTRFHAWKSLKLLNQNIAEQGPELADSTIASIVSAMMLAEMFEDHKAGFAHLTALRKIIELRGGVEAFSHNLQLQVKMWRLDIGWSLLTGEKPHYFREDLSWEPAFTSILGPCPGGVKTRRGACAIRSLLSAVDLRLSHVFADLRDFARMANQLFNARKLRPDRFQELMVSIEYRLLYMDLSGVDDVAEAFRLAMLAFLTTLFLQMHGFKFKFVWLADRLRELCQKIKAPEGVASEPARLVVAWTLVVADLAVFRGKDDEWLMPKLAGLRDDVLGPTWPEARASLRSVLWIDKVHDVHGFEVFERLAVHVAAASASDWLVDLEDLVEDAAGWSSSDFSSPGSVTSNLAVSR